MDDTRVFLRHTVATVAYRGGKAVREAPDTFGTFATGDQPKTPVAILAHIGDLFEWALSIARGTQAWSNATPLAWEAEIARFFATIKAFDDYLASEAPLGSEPERLFQGAIADGLTHIGQINMLRRLAGCPVKAENYHQADIAAGRVGVEQTAPRREF